MRKTVFSKDFILLWLGQAVSQLGNGAGFIAIMWWVQVETGSAVALGTLAMVQTLTGFLLSPLAGVVVDRLNRKHIIVMADLIRGLIYCFFAYAVWHKMLTLPMVLMGAAVNSACDQFFNPAVAAAVPQIVAKEFLDKANSLRQMTTNVISILGYTLGGVLVAILGIPMLLLIDGVSYLSSAFSEMFIHIPSVREKVKMNLKLFITDLKDGFLYIKKNTVLYKIIQVIGVINFCFVPFFVLLPKYVEEHLQAGSQVYGYITAAQMLGMFVGALLLTLVPGFRKNIWLVKYGIGIQATFLFVAPLIPGSLWQAQLVIFAVFGMINAVINIQFFTTLQKNVDPVFMGKVFSLVYAMSLGLQPVASALSGVLTEVVGITTIYMGAAVLAILSNVMLVRVPNLDTFFDAPALACEG
jgi:MFS family permease